jgi:trehalose 6-phosphate synthase
VDLALVTPLRDGMNLVAKEYVASQDASSPGVLILSRLTGAAEGLPEALLVNPHDVDDVANAIDTAAAMPLSERRQRWETMMSNLKRHDIHGWTSDFIGRLRSAAPGIDQPGSPPPVPQVAGEANAARKPVLSVAAGAWPQTSQAS